MKRLIFPQILLLLSGCEAPPPPPAPPPEPWPDDAERLFQKAEALRYDLMQQELERARLEAQGLEGAPPSPRR